MDKLGSEGKRLGDNDWYDKITSAANPLKGSVLEKALKAQRKFEIFANPGSVMNRAFEAQRILGERTRLGVGLSKTLADLDRWDKISGGLKAGSHSNLVEALKPVRGLESYLNSPSVKAFGAIVELGRLESQLRIASMDFMETQRKAWEFVQSGSIFNRGSLFEHLKMYEFEEDDLEPRESQKEVHSPIIKIDGTIRIQGLIKSIYDDHDEVFRIDPFDFEEAVAEMLRKKGFLIELTKKTHDGGKDIIALHDTNGLGMNKYLIECKRYRKDRPVDVNIVKAFCWTVERVDRANKGIIFTSSYFTRDAIKEQKANPYMLTLRDGADVIDWVKDYINSKKK